MIFGMRKIIALEFMTLDGGGPEEDTSGGFTYGGWCVPYSDKLTDRLMQEQMKLPFDLLLGRKTYDIWAAYWPQHAESWPGINDVTKYVVSHRPISGDWNNSVLVKDDIVEEIRKLKAGDGPNLHVYGSANLLQTLFKHDLVDELWLKTYPITLGTGKRLFADGTIAAAFTLTESKTTESGVIFANYERAGEVETGEF
jgi:dihydrofolate reductase